MKVAITGANGFVGTHLRKKFKNCVVLQRSDSESDILNKLAGVDVVINLAGAPIIKRWTPSYKKILIESRVETTRKLVSAVNKSDVRHFISTSAIGAYPSDAAYDESYDGYGDDFLSLLTKEWESEASKCEKLTAIVRFGVVLGNDGGALKSMLPAFKAGVGGTIGDGKMMTSWIDVDDLLGVINHIVEQKLAGVFNATAPNPITNYEFTKALGNALNRVTIIPIPKLFLKIIFGEASTVLTDSKEVYPKRIVEAGYKFRHPTINESLARLLKIK